MAIDNTEQNKIKIQKVHGTRYTILDEPVNNYTLVRVLCETHGIFTITPKVLKRGGGCKKCGRESAWGKRKKTIEEDISDFNNVHEGKGYTYPEKPGKGCEKFNVCCPIHGLFLIRVNDHKNGKGCPKCARLKTKNNLVKAISPEENLILFERVHRKYLHLS